MIIPYGTDAPIYHWPVATVGLIATNLLLWPASGVLIEEGYALDLGVGLHPLQWLTNNFLHGGIFHVVGNMVFLWAYGIIVEGKLGWWRYLLSYLAIGVVYGLTIQALYLGAPLVEGEPQHVLGASAIIFGLLGMCAVWAPKNCLNCLVFFMGFGRGFGDLWEIPILAFAVLEVSLEALGLFLRGATGLELLSSAFLHVTGFAWGFGLGVALLKSGLVDCEGWDLFSVSFKHFGRGSVSGVGSRATPRGKAPSRTRRKARKTRADSTTDTATASPEDRAGSVLEKIRSRLDEGETRSAFALYERSAPNWRAWGWGMPEADLLRLVKALHEATLEAESMPLMFEFTRRFPDRPVAHKMRLKLASLLIARQERPARALRVLAEIPDGALDPPLEAARRKLAAKAEAMCAEGVLELEGED